MNYEETKKMTKENISKAVSGSNGLISIITRRIENPNIVNQIPIKELLGYGERLTSLAQRNLKMAMYLDGVDYSEEDEDEQDGTANKVAISEELRERIRKILDGSDK